ncbi:MAG: DUF47 domain-containing protein [Candidatus Hecatellaceae archaeon]|nr:MAG: hypothetical protein DRO46_04175 [Candidatus Hecatellales archaeon]
MKSGSSIIWLGRQRERQILESCSKHMDKVLEVARESYNTFMAFCKGDLREVNDRFKRVFDLEREADTIKDKIIDEISKGVFHPINREEVIRLLLTVDDIADFAKTSARRLLFVNPKKLNPSLLENLRLMAELFIKAVEATNEAFKALLRDPREAVEASSRVERLEEKVDDFRFESIIPELLKWCEACRDMGQCLMVYSIIESMENLVDRCEVSADVIRHIAISYL